MRDKNNVSRINGFPLSTFDSSSKDAPISRWIGIDQCPARNECPAAVSDDVQLPEIRMDTRIIHGIKVVESNVVGRACEQLSALPSRRRGGLIERGRQSSSSQELRGSSRCERSLRRRLRLQ